MTKVDIGELKEIITGSPDITPTLALGTRIIMTNNQRLGDYTTFIVAGVDEFTPEIVITKKELKRFAQEVLEKLK